MALTIGAVEVDAWGAVAQNALVEGASVDVSGAYDALLHIDAFLDTTTAHNGTRIVVQLRSNTSGDEDWSDFRELLMVAGTAGSKQIAENPLSAGSTTLGMTDTSNFVSTGWRGIKDGTLNNSELVYQKAWTTNTNITLVDGTTHQHAQNTYIYNLAQRRVIELPRARLSMRVLYDNTYHSTGSSLVVASRLVRVTAL